jgi:hypothetical protein
MRVVRKPGKAEGVAGPASGTRGLSLAILFALAVTGPAAAHHSFAMFDEEKIVSLRGTIKEYQWVNPHSWLLVVVNENGKPVEYSLEMFNPAGLVKLGIKKSTFRAGDEVTVIMHPLRDGSKGGEFVRATLPDGTTLGRRSDRGRD